MPPSALVRTLDIQFRNDGIPAPETDSALLLSFLTGKAPLSLRLDTDTQLAPADLERYAALVDRRLKREPLQYITGQAPFLGRFFFVDNRVLIPRPETELLCLWALELVPDKQACVLDLCCGSGCIGLTLGAERHAWDITLSDISEKALEVSRTNSFIINLPVSFHCGDLTSGLPASHFDLIISNPPYIPSETCTHLQEEVLLEPLEALDGGNDGLSFFRRIALEVPRIAKPGARLLMEFGFGEGSAVSRILSDAGYNDIIIRQDMNRIARMICATVPYGRSYV